MHARTHARTRPREGPYQCVGHDAEVYAANVLYEYGYFRPNMGLIIHRGEQTYRLLR